MMPIVNVSEVLGPLCLMLLMGTVHCQIGYSDNKAIQGTMEIGEEGEIRSYTCGCVFSRRAIVEQSLEVN